MRVASIGERALRHARVLHRASATAAGIGEERRIELGAAHLVGVRVVGVERTPERERDALAGEVGDEFGAGLEHAHRRDLLRHPEAFEHGEVPRQQRFPDVEARMRVLLEQHDILAAIGKERGGGGTGRAAADDQHVAGLRHAVPSPFRPTARRGSAMRQRPSTSTIPCSEVRRKL